MCYRLDSFRSEANVDHITDLDESLPHLFVLGVKAVQIIVLLDIIEVLAASVLLLEPLDFLISCKDFFLQRGVFRTKLTLCFLKLIYFFFEFLSTSISFSQLVGPNILLSFELIDFPGVCAG